jgi:putative ATP-binding cassette transporter
VAFRGLTLVAPRDGRVLLKDLALEVPQGQRLLVTGPSGSGRTSLLRASAGIWSAGQGRIVRPGAADTLFLPQQPYLRSGPLREQLLYGLRGKRFTDAQLRDTLEQVGFDVALERLGGLDAEQDWRQVLSVGEQQQLAFARLLLASPRVAFLDEPTSSLEPKTAGRMYEALRRSPTDYVSVSNDPALRDFHDTVLEFGPDGSWTATPAEAVVPLAPAYRPALQLQAG